MIEGAATNESTSTFQLLSPADVEALPNLKYLIEGILPVPAFGVLYGPPGAGKSFVALSMALVAAGGEEWLGRPTKQGRVLYVAAEGALGMKKRLQAYRTRFAVSDDNVRFIGTPFDIRSKAHVEVFLAALNKADFRPSLIIIDTLARVAVGADENSARDMGEVVDGFETIKRETGATVLVIHHTRKDGGSERGSSALRGAADVMIECQPTEGDGTPAAELTCDKMKDDEPFKTFASTLEKVTLSGGDSSLVVGVILDIRKSLFDHGARIVELMEQKFGEAGASNSELQDEFREVANVSKSTFDRTLRDLKKSNRIRSEGSGKNTRYYPVGVKCHPGVNKCQTPTDIGVMSPPSLGGDTDTNRGGREKIKS